MIYCLRRNVVPDRYFAAYEEFSVLQPGWRERAPLIYLRELLSLLAHFPDRVAVVQFVMPLIDHVIATFG
jgi:hypothetical protein